MQLIIKVDRPIPILTFLATPSAKTVQGVTPFKETTKTLSPIPNKNKPKQRKKNVLKVSKLDAFDGTIVIDIKPYDNYDIVSKPSTP